MMDLLTEKELEQIQQKGSDFMGKPTNEYGTPVGGGQFNPNQRQFGGAQNEVFMMITGNINSFELVGMLWHCFSVSSMFFNL